MKKQILILLVLAASIFAVQAQTMGPSPTIEMRPAENAMEQLFNKGVGQPWVGGEPFSSSGEPGGIAVDTKTIAAPATPSTAQPAQNAEYRLIATIDSASTGLSLVDPYAYNGTVPGVTVNAPAGRYNVYGIYQSGAFMGLWFEKIA